MNHELTLVEGTDNEYVYRGYKVIIEYDDDPSSPRDNDNLGTMSYIHPKYNLGDEYIYGHAIDELSERLARECIYLPLYLYDHSGLTMNTTGFSCQWDSGLVGYIWVDRAKVREEYGCSRISPKLKETVLNVLRAEVAEFDQYLTGEVYGYTITSPDGVQESLWGIIGLGECKWCVTDSIDYQLDNVKVSA